MVNYGARGGSEGPSNLQPVGQKCGVLKQPTRGGI